MSFERRLAYEESARIPLLIRYPSMIRPGTRIDKIALNLDLAPTLLEMAGLGPLEGVQGHSLVPLLKGDARSWRDSFLIEYFTDKVFPRVANMGYRCLRTEQWKYIHYTELAGMDELYDLSNDPYEMKNRIHDVVAQLVLTRMKRDLEQL